MYLENLPPTGTIALRLYSHDWITSGIAFGIPRVSSLQRSRFELILLKASETFQQYTVFFRRFLNINIHMNTSWAIASRARRFDIYIYMRIHFYNMFNVNKLWHKQRCYYPFCNFADVRGQMDFAVICLVIY